jgi:hypothetical protein
MAPSQSDVKQMHYLMACVHESARLLPSAPFLQRCSLQSGNYIYTIPWMLHTNTVQSKDDIWTLITWWTSGRIGAGLANVMTDMRLSIAFRKYNRNSGQRFGVMVCPDHGWIIMHLSMATVGSWWSQYVVTSSLSVWWWCATLWVTLIRLWLHSLLVCCGDFSAISWVYRGRACLCMDRL